MNLSKQLAKHFREIHFGGNWTCSNLKDQLADVTWQQAITPVHSFNTIATLTYHVTYYVSAVLKVLEGGPLHAKDELSFNHPSITCEEDWKTLQEKAWIDAEAVAALIEELPESRLWEDFTDIKYGIYYRNLQGIIEHMHYHLGQIVILKKLIQQTDKS